MNKPYLYQAFGFVIRSEFRIAQLPAADESAEVDIMFCRNNLTSYNLKENHYRFVQRELLFSISEVATFHVVDGSCVEVDPDEKCSESVLGVYLMGSCMGAVLHQRGFMPLHGSCVTNGVHAVLITGDSGAGKSTLAAEFLKQGWKLLTDDVAAVSDAEAIPMVRSSYPSQKLWQDALTRYDRPEEDIHSLYFTENRQKFGVNVAEYFLNGEAPLSMIVRLLPTGEPCSISPIEGIVKIDQLMYNTYRIFMVPPEQRERHFRRCAAIAERVPMMLLTRQEGAQCAEQLYSLVVDHL